MILTRSVQDVKENISSPETYFILKYIINELLILTISYECILSPSNELFLRDIYIPGVHITKSLC